MVAQDSHNADAYNLLGYTYRQLGKYPESFAAYDQALTLNPNHKGALNYEGIAYVLTHQMEKAQANLAKLRALCANCDETTTLAKAIAEAGTEGY